MGYKIVAPLVRQGCTAYHRTCLLQPGRNVSTIPGNHFEFANSFFFLVSTIHQHVKIIDLLYSVNYSKSDFTACRKDQPMKLTKAEIIDSICNKVGCNRNRSSELVAEVIEILKSTLIQGEDVLISGFGKFQVLHKNERRGRNPATGDAMQLPPRKVVTFKCSGILRNKVNE
jgi:integration host factor subunit alpha